MASRLGFKKTIIHPGLATLIWDPTLVERLKRRYDIGDIPGKASTSSTSSTPALENVFKSYYR